MITSGSSAYRRPKASDKGSSSNGAASCPAACPLLARQDSGVDRPAPALLGAVGDFPAARGPCLLLTLFGAIILRLGVTPTPSLHSLTAPKTARSRSQLFEASTRALTLRSCMSSRSGSACSSTWVRLILNLPINMLWYIFLCPHYFVTLPAPCHTTRRLLLG